MGLMGIVIEGLDVGGAKVVGGGRGRWDGDSRVVDSDGLGVAAV